MRHIQNSDQTDSASSWAPEISYVKCQETELEKIIQNGKQIIAEIEVIHSLRVIEKLARPIPLGKKYELIRNLRKELQITHQKMKGIEKNQHLKLLAMEKQNKFNQREKKKVEKNMHAKLVLFNIRKKYAQVLVNSSFVYFKTICKTLSINLNQPIQIMDIEKWLVNCLQKLQGTQKTSEQTCC